MAVTDLIVACMFLSMTPAVRDSAVLKGDAKDQSIIIVSLSLTKSNVRPKDEILIILWLSLQGFQTNVAAIQETGIYWLYSIVPRMFRPNKKEFGVALNKVKV